MPLAPAVSTRNGAIDHLRFVAALGIVWFHAQAPGSSVTYAGLTVFLQLAIVLAILTDRGAALPDYLRSRANRLLRPWLVWSLIYAGVRIADIMIKHQGLDTAFAPWMILTGTAIHLWFLPFIAVVGTLAVVLARRLPDGWSVPTQVLTLVLALAAAPAGQVLSSAAIGVPFAQWANAVGPVLSGVAIGLGARQGRNLWPIGLAILAGAAIALGLNLAGGMEMIPAALTLLPLALGTALTVLALTRPLPATGLSQRLAAISLPIYLMHPMVLSLLGHTGSAGPALAAIAVTTVLGLALYGSRVWAVLF